MPVAPHDAARRVADLDDVVVVLLVRDDRVPARREECVVVEVEARLSRPARVAPQDVAGRIDHEHAVVPAVGDEEVAGQRAAEPARQPAVAACRMRTAHRPAGRRRSRAPPAWARRRRSRRSRAAVRAGWRRRHPRAGLAASPRRWTSPPALTASTDGTGVPRGADPADDVHAAAERAGRRMHAAAGAASRSAPRARRRREPVDRAARARLGPAAGDQDGVPQAPPPLRSGARPEAGRPARACPP